MFWAGADQKLATQAQSIEADFWGPTVINTTLSAPGKRKHCGRPATVMNSAFYVITRRSTFRHKGLLLQLDQFSVFRTMLKENWPKQAEGKRVAAASLKSTLRDYILFWEICFWLPESLHWYIYLHFFILHFFYFTLLFTRRPARSSPEARNQLNSEDIFEGKTNLKFGILRMLQQVESRDQSGEEDGVTSLHSGSNLTQAAWRGPVSWQRGFRSKGCCIFRWLQM